MTRDPRFLYTIRALLIDIDGTLWRGKTPTPGLVEFFDFLRHNQIAYTVATNNSVEPATVYRQRLEAFGVPMQMEHILTVSMATADYLLTILQPGASIYMIGQEGLRQALSEAGFNIRTDAKQPVEAVVVGGDLSLSYEKFKHATLLIHAGARFIGTNPDVVYPTEEGLAPECGANLAFVAATTGIQPLVIGKPQPYLFQMGMQRMGASPQHTAMIGDRLETDIHGARQAGMHSILVTTGVDNEQTMQAKRIFPDLVVANLGELAQVWQTVI